MEKPDYRFFKGEEASPFDRERDLSRFVFWTSERMFDATASSLDLAAFYSRWRDDAPDFVKDWKVSDEDKGLLMWAILQCERWAPYDAGEVNWELYTRSTRR